MNLGKVLLNDWSFWCFIWASSHILCLILATGQFRQVHTYVDAEREEVNYFRCSQMLPILSIGLYTGADFSGSTLRFLPSQRLHPCCLLRLDSIFLVFSLPCCAPRSILALTDLVLRLFIYPRFNYLLI